MRVMGVIFFLKKIRLSEVFTTWSRRACPTKMEGDDILTLAARVATLELVSNALQERNFQLERIVQVTYSEEITVPEIPQTL
jgi:hypothetical protein